MAATTTVEINEESTSTLTLLCLSEPRFRWHEPDSSRQV